MINHFSDNSRGCGSDTSIPTDKECPGCGKKLRMTGNLQKLKLYLACYACDYQSPELSLDELHALL